jgi:NAD+ diphosphatase
MLNDHRALIFRGGQILLREGRLPSVQEASALALVDQGSMGNLGPAGSIWGRVESDCVLPEGFEALERRELKKLGGMECFKLGASAWGLADWHSQARFCGRCGTPMIPAPGEERAMKCPKCGHMLFPIMCPAVIVAVEKDGRLLLAKNKMSPFKHYSILAGFVEVGESFEDAVHREIMEEVSIEVQDLRYFGSQHWPFPRSLMVGFTAKWKSGEVKADGIELSEARWFDLDEIPANTPSTVSIAGRLIEDFKARHRKSGAAD